MSTMTITLPSGRTAVVRPGTAGDLVNAQMMVTTQEQLPLALVSMLVEIDGTRMMLEDVTAMPLPDFLALLPALGLSQPTRPVSCSVSAASPAGASAS